MILDSILPLNDMHYDYPDESDMQIFKFTPLLMGLSYNCPSTNEAVLKHMGKYTTWTHNELIRWIQQTKHNKTMCTVFEIYCKIYIARANNW